LLGFLGSIYIAGCLVANCSFDKVHIARAGRIYALQGSHVLANLDLL
jgi:hypothetical protein